MYSEETIESICTSDLSSSPYYTIELNPPCDFYFCTDDKQRLAVKSASATWLDIKTICKKDVVVIETKGCKIRFHNSHTDLVLELPNGR